MPDLARELIRDGQVVSDDSPVPPGLEEYNQRGGNAVILEPGETPDLIQGDLASLDYIAINFPVFADGRGFSYARELRELGYVGELRAVGYFMRDQLFYMQRCGFNAFQFAADQQQSAELEACLASLKDFSEVYQASVDQPQPLFQRCRSLLDTDHR